MATESFTLDQEMKRRRSMILSLVGGVVLTTLAVSNDRALFSQAAVSSGAPPVAYAFVPPAEDTDIGGLARSPGATRNFVAPRRTNVTGTPGGLGGQPEGPVAFAVQTPVDGPAAISAASSFAAPGAVPASNGGGQQFAGNPGGDFGGSNGGVGGSAVGPTDPSTPPGTTDPTAPPLITDPATPPGTTDPVTPGPVSPVPEPATWLMMILGFGFIGAMLRRARRSTQTQAVSAKAIAN